MVTVLAVLGTIFLALDHRSLLSCPTQLIKPCNAKAKSSPKKVAAELFILQAAGPDELTVICVTRFRDPGYITAQPICP